MEIKDKVAIITGAASGIGRAACAELVKQGVSALAMVDISDAVVDAAAELDTTGSADRKSTRLNSSHSQQSRMPSSA